MIYIIYTIYIYTIYIYMLYIYINIYIYKYIYIYIHIVTQTIPLTCEHYCVQLVLVHSCKMGLGQQLSSKLTPPEGFVQVEIICFLKPFFRWEIVYSIYSTISRFLYIYIYIVQNNSKQALHQT